MKTYPHAQSEMLGPSPNEIRLAKLSAFSRARAGTRRKFNLPDEFLGPTVLELAASIRRQNKKRSKKEWSKRPEIARRLAEKKRAYLRTDKGREWALGWSKQYREKNRATLRRNYKRYNADPKRKLNHRLRVRLSKFYRGRNVGGCVGLTGLTRDQLFAHMQSLLKPGMSFENYGTKWHIDHIVPCSAFDLTRIDEVKRCFHFTNLRPLWAAENMSKGSKMIKRQIELPMAA